MKNERNETLTFYLTRRPVSSSPFHFVSPALSPMSSLDDQKLGIRVGVIRAQVASTGLPSALGLSGNDSQFERKPSGSRYHHQRNFCVLRRPRRCCFCFKVYFDPSRGCEMSDFPEPGGLRWPWRRPSTPIRPIYKPTSPPLPSPPSPAPTLSELPQILPRSHSTGAS